MFDIAWLMQHLAGIVNTGDAKPLNDTEVMAERRRFREEIAPVIETAPVATVQQLMIS